MLPQGEVLAKHAWPIIAIINKLSGNYECGSEQRKRSEGNFISNNGEQTCERLGTQRNK